MKLSIDLEVGTENPGRSEAVLRTLVEKGDVLEALRAAYELETGSPILNMDVPSRFDCFAEIQVSFSPSAVREHLSQDSDRPTFDDELSYIEAAGQLEDHELFLAADRVIGRDETLWGTYDELCAEIVRTAWAAHVR